MQLYLSWGAGRQVLAPYYHSLGISLPLTGAPLLNFMEYYVDADYDDDDDRSASMGILQFTTISAYLSQSVEWDTAWLWWASDQDGWMGGRMGSSSSSGTRRERKLLQTRRRTSAIVISSFSLPHPFPTQTAMAFPIFAQVSPVDGWWWSKWGGERIKSWAG